MILLTLLDQDHYPNISGTELKVVASDGGPCGTGVGGFGLANTCLLLKSSFLKCLGENVKEFRLMVSNPLIDEAFVFIGNVKKQTTTKSLTLARDIALLL